MKNSVKMPPIHKNALQLATTDNQLAIRDPIEVRKAVKQSDMLRDMKEKFALIERQMRKDPNFEINEKDMELLKSYVIASAQPMQSIKLLKEQAKEREAAEEYERELEQIIQRAEIVDRTTKEYTNEQRDAISLITGKDKILKEAAKLYESEVQREKEEDKKILDLDKEIEKVRAENLALERKNKMVVRGINKMKQVKEFLEEVAKSQEEFDKKIELVKNRFETLRSGTVDLKRNLEALDKKIEQEKISSINKIEDLDKEILLEQNKRPDIRRRLEEYERKINILSDKEKHGNENLIKKHKKWIQMRLAIDHLIDFVDKFTEVSTAEDVKQSKVIAKPSIQQEENINTDTEAENLENQIVKLKKIKKQATYWYNVYGTDLSGFNPNYLYDEIKAKKKGTLAQCSSPSKKKVEGGSTTKEITFTEAIKKKPNH